MTTKAVAHWSDALVKLSACAVAIDFAKTQPDLATAWKLCDRGDWMLWLAERFAGPAGSDARRPLVLAACGCARLALARFEERNPTESRPRKAIETAESWARNSGATLAKVHSAAYAVAAAAAVAGAAVDAAFAAAAAAAYAVDAYAVDAAYAAAYAARSTARTDTLKRCADIVRAFYPNPPELSK
jgi:hypothetical protein